MGQSCACHTFDSIYFMELLTALELNEQEDEKARKIILIVAIVVDLLLLGVYKYTGFVMNILHIQSSIQIALPVGLSFFTFSELSYLFDVYNNKSEPQRNLISYSLYVSFFGKSVWDHRLLS